jgi:V8-like Glu-specific endopeptidase
MKTKKFTLTIVALCCSYMIFAQSTEASNVSKQDKTSYYEMRAKEDAKYEQQLRTDSKEEDEDFWKEQKDYEKELKRRDRVAYRAYMRGKKDTYKAHYHNCDHHCLHSDRYYQYATFYYYGYHDHYYYQQNPRSSNVNARVSVGIPKVRLSLF